MPRSNQSCSDIRALRLYLRYRTPRQMLCSRFNETFNGDGQICRLHSRSRGCGPASSDHPCTIPDTGEPHGEPTLPPQQAVWGQPSSPEQLPVRWAGARDEGSTGRAAGRKGMRLTGFPSPWHRAVAAISMRNRLLWCKRYHTSRPAHETLCSQQERCRAVCFLRLGSGRASPGAVRAPLLHMFSL